MKTLIRNIILALICLGTINVVALGQNNLTYSEFVNSGDDYYINTTICAKDIVYNEDDNIVTFTNTYNPDSSVYILNSDTLYNEYKIEGAPGLKEFINGEIKWIHIRIPKSKYFEYSKKENVINVPAVIDFSANVAGVGQSVERPEYKYNVLTAFEILKGDEYGRLNLESNVTRAEMAQFIINMLCLRNASNNYVPIDNKFTDVPESHWAYNTIHFAKQIGHINGMGNDMFAPDANVTFEQAVKMIVSILGYQTLAEERGGYPHGYIQVASIIGLTENMDFANSDYATREDICDLLLSALYLPVRQQTVFGSEPEYAIMNGENGNPYIRFYDVYLDT